MAEPIELYKPEVTEQELHNATTVVANNGLYTRGQEVGKFEDKLAATVGMEHAVAVSNGTTALHLAVMGMGWKDGDKVITSPLSFIATSNVLLQERCAPVFGKVDEETLQLDASHMYDLVAADPEIKGILIPHIFGHAVDNEGLARIKKDFPHIGIIEDNAQALAEEERGLGVGQVSDAVCYSFHENKVMTTFGEGGAVLTNSDGLAKKMLAMREQGRVNDPNWLSKIELGYNYRMTEVQAVVGSQQLDRLPEILDKRAAIAQKMSELALAKGLPVSIPDDVPRSWFGYYVVTDTPEIAAKAVKDLSEQGIQARQTPMPAITEFAHIQKAPHEDYSQGIGRLATRILMLPLHTQMTEGDATRVVDGLEASLIGPEAEVEIPGTVSSNEFYDALAASYEASRIERQAYLYSIENLAIDAINDLGVGSPKILDIGCGDGVRGIHVAQATNGQLKSVDAAPQMVAAASKVNPNSYVLDIGAKEFDPTMHQSDVALMFWNVLGHVPKDNRLQALKNVYDLLGENGRIILDVNNQFNAAQYGTETALRNRTAIAMQDPSHTGDFAASRNVDGEKVSTPSHIFYTEEIVSLLQQAGFNATVRYVNYETGQLTDEENGQIFLVASKK